MSIYSHPFSASYWKDAVSELKNLKKLTFAALMIALCVMLSYIPSVPLFGGAKLTWGFLGRSVCAMVCGPVMSVFFAVAEDLLSFFLTGGGVFILPSVFHAYPSCKDKGWDRCWFLGY